MLPVSGPLPCYGNSAFCSQSIPDSGDAAFKVCCSCLVESPQLADPLSCLVRKASDLIGICDTGCSHLQLQDLSSHL